MAFGVLIMGGLDELQEKVETPPTVLKFEVEPVGWKG